MAYRVYREYEGTQKLRSVCVRESFGRGSKWGNGERIRMRTICAYVVSLAVVFAFAGVAMAGPRSDQYNNKVAQVSSKPKSTTGVASAHANKPAPTLAQAAKGALPFTGFQLSMAFAVGAGLVGAGIFFRRMGRPGNSDS